MILAVAGDIVPAQDAVPDCVQGNLKDNYLDQECAVGNLTFKFGGDFGGKTAVDPANVVVSPLSDPPGLSFELPAVTLPKGDRVSVLYSSELRSSSNLVSARLGGSLAGKDVRIHLSLVGLPEKSRDSTILELLSLIDHVTGLFKPPRKVLRLVYSLDIGEAAQPAFSVRFASAK